MIHDWDAMLDRYYRLRGWDKDGRPTREVLQRLDLPEVAGDVPLTLSKSERSAKE
jgi:aldehyde:ferredoxin oxidoreductase